MNELVRTASLDRARVFTMCFLINAIICPPSPSSLFVHISVLLLGTCQVKNKGVIHRENIRPLPSPPALAWAPETHFCTGQGSLRPRASCLVPVLRLALLAYTCCVEARPCSLSSCSPSTGSQAEHRAEANDCLLGGRERGVDPYSAVSFASVIAVQELVDSSQESLGTSGNQVAKLSFSFESVQCHLSSLCLHLSVTQR